MCLLLEERARAMKRLDLLKQVTFGAQVAEDEVNALESYFVETNEWARMIRGEIDIVRGEKGLATAQYILYCSGSQVSFLITILY
jgi:hypothetical protein